MASLADTMVCPVCRENIEQPVRVTSTCDHVLCLGCSERWRMAQFIIKENTPPGEFTFVVNSNCPMCREAMPSFNDPFCAAPGLAFTCLACPLCGDTCGTVASLLTHMVQRCEQRYPSCPLCSGILSPDDNPNRHSGRSRKASMTKHWREHLRNVCGHVPCTSCWRTGTWAVIKRCQYTHAVFDRFLPMMTAAMSELRRLDTGPHAAVAADMYARLQVWQRQLFMTQPPPGHREEMEEMGLIGAEPESTDDLSGTEYDTNDDSDADSDSDSDDSDSDDDSVAIVLAPRPVPAQVLADLLSSISMTRPGNPGPS